MTQTQLPQGPVTRQQLGAVAQLLNQDPASYHAYGLFWWTIKALLRREMGGEARLWFLGPADEPRSREMVARIYPQEQQQFAAALEHYRRKVEIGEIYADHSYLPGRDMTPYTLYDPDMDAANAPVHG